MLQGHPGHDPSAIANSQPLGFLLLPQTQWRAEVICHCIIHLRLPYQSTVISRPRVLLHVAIQQCWSGMLPQCLCKQLDVS